MQILIVTVLLTVFFSPLILIGINVEKRNAKFIWGYKEDYKMELMLTWVLVSLWILSSLVLISGN